jgi:hypothetical protein
MPWTLLAGLVVGVRIKYSWQILFLTFHRYIEGSMKMGYQSHPPKAARKNEMQIQEPLPEVMAGIEPAGLARRWTHDFNFQLSAFLLCLKIPYVP